MKRQQQMNSADDAKAHCKTNNTENTIAGNAQTSQIVYPIKTGS